MYKPIVTEKMIVAIGIFIVTILLQFLLAYLFQLAWNLTLPGLFSTTPITYLQSVIFIVVIYFASLKFKVSS